MIHEQQSVEIENEASNIDGSFDERMNYPRQM